MKTLEFLYPHFCNIYAERYNVDYLSHCTQEITVHETHVGDTPLFTSGKADMVYLGCATEKNQEKIISELVPFKDELNNAIESGTIFLVTGNSIEVFGKYIKDGETEIPALGLFDYYSVRYMDEFRHNTQYIGDLTDDEEKLTLLGHRSQFSFSYGDFPNPLIENVELGIGMNPDVKNEGVHINNFFATYSLGPYFILNPPFCKYILRKLGLSDALYFEKEAMEAYEYRLAELRRLSNNL